MRVVSTLVLVALLAACEGGSRQAPARDASADVAPPAPFVPYTPSPTVPPATGGGNVGGGAAGAAGMAGPAVTGAGGFVGMIGTGGMAGPGAGGMAMGGGPGQMPPPRAFCDSQPKKTLPVPIDKYFNSRFALHPDSLTIVNAPNCNQTLFPDAAPTPPLPFDAGLPGANDPATSALTCSEFKYDPEACAAMNPSNTSGACWSAVFFTTVPNAGLQGPGICIEPGATAVHFKARASKDNARVKFGAIREGLNATEFFFNLTRVWRSYTLMIPAGDDYNSSGMPGGVWDAFHVVLEPQDHAGGTYVFVADVVWDR